MRGFFLYRFFIPSINTPHFDLLTTAPCTYLCARVSRVPRRDLRRIATATGATILPNLADLDGGESVEASSLGSAAEVAEETLGDQQFVFVRGAANTGAASVILRGANEFMLDEVDRSLHDALMVSVCVVCIWFQGFIDHVHTPHARTRKPSDTHTRTLSPRSSNARWNRRKLFQAEARWSRRATYI